MAKSEKHDLTIFAEREYIDINRSCKILGVSRSTVVRLGHSGRLRMVAYRTNSWKKVHYHSIVEFCDKLREQYRIPNRRPMLSAQGLRHRDEDLLPFPLKETMTADEAYAALGVFRHQLLIELIEEGRFEAYRIVAGAAWRIHRPSFAKYIAEARRGIQNGPRAYVVTGDDCGL